MGGYSTTAKHTATLVTSMKQSIALAMSLQLLPVLRNKFPLFLSNSEGKWAKDTQCFGCKSVDGCS